MTSLPQNLIWHPKKEEGYNPKGGLEKKWRQVVEILKIPAGKTALDSVEGFKIII